MSSVLKNFLLNQDLLINFGDLWVLSRNTQNSFSLYDLLDKFIKLNWLPKHRVGFNNLFNLLELCFNSRIIEPFDHGLKLISWRHSWIDTTLRLLAPWGALRNLANCLHERWHANAHVISNVLDWRNRNWVVVYNLDFTILHIMLVLGDRHFVLLITFLLGRSKLLFKSRHRLFVVGSHCCVVLSLKHFRARSRSYDWRHGICIVSRALPWLHKPWVWQAFPREIIKLFHIFHVVHRNDRLGPCLICPNIFKSAVHSWVQRYCGWIVIFWQI